MKTISRMIAAFLLTALLLSGCAMTIDEMYCLPRRSEEYNDLQGAIDAVMNGMVYWAPISGENQQTVQLADLDGDNVMEALLFAKGSGEKPLKIFVFKRINGEYENVALLEGGGTAFEQIEYAELDGEPGVELVVGRQVSDQVLHSVAVYSFRNGKLEQRLATGYTKFLITDLDQDGQKELFLLRPGTEDEKNGIAELYVYRNGTMERTMEAALTGPVQGIKRITVGNMDRNFPAVFVASLYGENVLVTDVFALRSGALCNIAAQAEGERGVRTVQSYFVYANDVDGDGLIELPVLTPMRQLVSDTSSAPSLIEWYNLDRRGTRQHKLLTYHNFADGWYIILPEAWKSRLALFRGDDGYVFYDWSGESDTGEVIFTVYAFSGEDSERLATSDGRFILAQKGDIVYAASIGSGKLAGQTNEQALIQAFQFIKVDWKTGDT